MKVKLIFHFLLAALAMGLFSCEKEKPAAAGNYTEGVFVVNEGPFGGTGTISWLNPATGETVQDVFALANGGAALGEFVQSLTLHNGKGYIVVSGANKIYVVDAVTFTFIDTIPGLALPRYLLPLDDHLALVSQWGADGLTGSIARVDLNSFSVVGTIPTGRGPDKLIRQADGLVVAPNSGGYGVDSTVSLLNLGNTGELDRIVVRGKNPGTAAVAGFSTGPLGPNTFVLCQGSFLDAGPKGWVGPVSAAAGAGFDVAAYGNDLIAAPDGQTLYFAAGNKIYAVDGSGLRVLFDQPAWGLGVDPVTGYLFCGDPKDFNSAGEVVVYKTGGEKVGTYPCGVVPGEFVFIR